jgi:hypothetical protein
MKGCTCSVFLVIEYYHIFTCIISVFNENCKDKSPWIYLCFNVVVGIAWSYDSDSYAGSSVATGRVSNARQVKGDDPDKKGYLSMLGVGHGAENHTP